MQLAQDESPAQTNSQVMHSFAASFEHRWLVESVQAGCERVCTEQLNYMEKLKKSKTRFDQFIDVARSNMNLRHACAR